LTKKSYHSMTVPMVLAATILLVGARWRGLPVSGWLVPAVREITPSPTLAICRPHPSLDDQAARRLFARIDQVQTLLGVPNTL
jgi:hypothetical protein